MLGNLRKRLDQLGAKRDAILDTDRKERSGKLLTFYTNIVRKIAAAERCSIFVLDPTTDKIWLKSGTGLVEHDIEVSREGSIVGQVVETGEPVILSDLEHKEGAHRATDEKTGFVTRSIMCVPILSPDVDQIVGALEALNKGGAGEFDEEDLENLKEIAAHLRTEVSRVFLDQEIIGLAEEIYTVAKWSTGLLVGLIVVLLLGAFITFGYVLV
jgi:GAF domain-containing protein